MALILAAVMAVSCLTTILLAASKPWTEIDLGSLSQYYETGTNADPGRISNVDGDSGGTSYGLYMFVENTVTSFMDWLKKSDSAVYRGFGDRLYNAYAYNTSGQYYPGFGSNFKNTWQEIGRNNRTEFAQAQTDFWRETQYTQLVANVEGQYKGFDIDNYSNALKNVFWSRSVHHGVGATYGSTKNTDGMSGATGVICRAFKALGGFKNQSEAELIAAIYAECSKLDTNGKWKEDNMETLTAKKYGIYGRSMAYFNINSGGVQTSVYSRLHVNEPADALVMRYTHSDPDIPEGKYTLLYNNNGEQNHGLGKSVSTLTAAADAMMLRLTYYNNGYYILTNDDGQRLSVSGGKLVLEAASTSNNQFWILGGGSGYTLQNVGTKQYVTVTVTSADVTADGQNRDDLIAAKVKEIAQTPAEGQTNAAAEDFSARLEKKLNDLFDEQFKDKNDEAIMAEITANISAMQDITEENKTTLIKKLESLAQSEEETKDDLEARIMESFTADELLLLTEAMTGKSIETVIVEVVGEMVDEDLKNNPTTTVTTYTVGMTDASDKAARWALNKATGKDAWKLTGLFYPGCKDSDGIGGTISHVLTEGNSSFPLRGVISCTQGIRTVVVEVSKVNGSGGFTATGNGSGKTWFDLWELDSQATFSKLTQGSYTMTISGTGSDGKEEELLSTGFTVGAKDSNTPSGLDKEAYTVTFMNGNTQVATKTYSLGDVYGKLPEVSGAGFVGWFTKDGRQVYENSMVAAENHTLSAQFGTLYTVSFKVDGEVIRSRQLSANDLIVAPSNPVKAADKNYVYSFSHWVDGSGNRFVENMTYMPAGNVTYTAVFTKTANSGGTGGSTGGSTGGNTGTNTPTPSGNYLTGVSPSTSVSAMNRAGYTIYNGSAKVTSGLVGTGMTAVSSSATVTIVVTGDVSGDGKITITDVVKLQKSVVGSGSLSGAYAKAADINGDGKVTITDVVQAAQVTVGQRTIG
jgi:predicted house-cleaning noncanonical NTP pyrophosphatase (MazG superfamily)